MLGSWRQGLTLAERRDLRDLLAEWYADHGHDEDVALRRISGGGCAGPPGPHEPCSNEQPGGAGCPCECHDPMADEMAALTARLART